jgi:hypothetical protein
VGGVVLVWGSSQRIGEEGGGMVSLGEVLVEMLLETGEVDDCLLPTSQQRCIDFKPH